MDTARFGPDFPGELLSDEGYPTYNPDPLPPELEFSGELITKLGTARGAIGKLAGIGQLVSESRMLLLGPFVRREAVYSSRIEGTFATVSAVYAHEAGEDDALEGTTRDEAAEVLNYVRATEQGLAAIEDEGITTALLQELHATLMRDVRGGDKQPGSFRADQRAIGARDPRTARYVPPPPHVVPYEMELLVEYVRDGGVYDPLIDIALAHYQFETIHPFADGNGRMGRLLITLLLDEYDLLPDPFLYFSSYFNTHRTEYVDRLFEVNARGAWEEWLLFFLDGVIDQSKEVFIRSRELLELRDEYRRRYQNRRSETILDVVYELFTNPVITINAATERTGNGYQSCRTAINELEADGVLTEVTGKDRYKVYRATEITDVIERPVGALVDDIDAEFENYAAIDDGQAGLDEF